MNESKPDKLSAKFADALREAVERTYCLGGASKDEFRFACADFLMTTANMFIRSIETDVELPPLR